MPAIQVARTDTFEQQRKKINQIGNQIFNISEGGSDLATGNLKLGDGSRTIPSLAFSSDASLGLFKPEASVIAYVASGKRLFDISKDSGGIFYKDFTLRKNTLITSGLTVFNTGENYDAGQYTNIPLTGGTGEGALADISIYPFDGQITNLGSNYNEGSFSNIFVTGGSEVSFNVDGIDGYISNNGSGLVPGIYNNVPLTGGSGSGAEAEVQISGTITLVGSITNPGSGYTDGTYESRFFYNQPNQTYILTVISNPGTPPPDNVYVVDGNTQQALTFEKGNTYRFDISDSSLSGHPLVFQTSSGGTLNNDYYIVRSSGYLGSAGAFTDIIIKPDAPTETIKYNCSAHDGMGASISIVDGVVGNYGSDATGTIEISSGQVTSVTVTNTGSDYKQGDTLIIPNDSIGGTGAGFLFTLSTPVYDGTVFNVTITNNGQDYQINDVLSASVSDIGGSGSSFQYTVESNPGLIKDFVFSQRTSNYSVNDIIELPKSVSGITTNLKGSISGISTTLSDVSAVITVADTTGILPGMNVDQDLLNDVGRIALYSTVLSVDSATQITLSDIPDVAGAATLTFTSPGRADQIVVSSISGIYQGSILVQTAGTGALPTGITVTEIDQETNTLTLSEDATRAGTATITFVPPFGDPADDFQYTVQKLGSLESVVVADGGNGYALLDQLSINPSDLTQPITYAVTNKSVTKITFSSSIPDTTFTVGSSVYRKSGGVITTLINSSSTVVGQEDQTYTNVASTTTGSGIGATFDVTRGPGGEVNLVSVNTGGYFYAVGDTITISGALVGGSSSVDDIELEVFSAETIQNLEIYKVNSSSGFVDSIITDSDVVGFANGDILLVSGTTSPEYTVDTSLEQYRFFIDYGNGEEITPNLTLFSGNIYVFDLSDNSNSGHNFSLSKFRDGIWGPSYIQDISSTLLVTSQNITVSNSTGILPGMEVSVSSGLGVLSSSTFVESVNGNTVTLSKLPTTSGTVVLEFRGVEYTDGVERSEADSSLTLKVTDSTPTLYYYCSTDDNDQHLDEGGSDNLEAQITIDLNNPKVFGSGLLISVSEINTEDVYNVDILTGEMTANTVTSSNSSLGTAAATSLNCSSIVGGQISLTDITGGENLYLTATNFNITSNVEIGSKITIAHVSGNITTTGVLKTIGSLNINDKLVVTDNNIASTGGNDIILTPYSGKLAKVSASTALVVPKGDSGQRPPLGVAEDGSIRFNTETNQYEGYNSSTTSWSSLGGVRDIDGNTYILAELTAGANDNTLWFYNDNVNTLRLTSQFLDFRSVKTISSGKLGLPSFTLWTANTPVNVGDFIKYRNNLYEVTAAGTTASTGNEPVHTSGVLNNGTAQFTWYSSSVSPLAFSEILELRVAPNKDAPLIVNDSIKIGGTTSADWNTISTLVEDLTIRPNPGKKVVVDSYTHFAIPAGNNNQKNTASAIAGSIRFNTEIQQFEGYSGSNWSSLGGVRDVDGNTYIIPETAPAANENILYFYNDNLNTLQLSKTSLDFTNIDTITTSGLSNLSIDTPLVTLNGNETSIDNRDIDRTFISTSKQYLDLGLSSGLVVDTVMRLDDQGDVYLNTTFGSGSFNGVKVLDGELKEFELADYAIKTSSFQLAKGSAESSSVILYPNTRKGCKVTVVSKSSSGKKSMSEYAVIDNGTDVFHNEYLSLNTSLDQYSALFDLTAQNEARISLTLTDDHANGDIVSFTVLVQVIK